MIDYWLELGRILVAVCVSLLFVAFYVKWKYGAAEAAIKKGMSALGLAGVDARKVKQVEKAVTNDLINAQMPEIKALLGFISPETLELIEANPEIALGLIEKYKPMIDKFIPTLLGGKGDEKKKGYDF